MSPLSFCADLCRHANLDSLLGDLESVYKDLHSHPELSMEENRTAQIASDRLGADGYEVTTGVGKTAWSVCCEMATVQQLCCAPTWSRPVKEAMPATSLELKVRESRARGARLYSRPDCPARIGAGELSTDQKRPACPAVFRLPHDHHLAVLGRTGRTPIPTCPSL